MAQAAASASPGYGPDYGLDAPRLVRSLYSRAGWTLAFALVLYGINRAEYPGPAARMAGAVALIALGFLAAALLMRWYSRTGKLRLRDRMLDALALEGSERVLEVGCGRGLLAIGAAKRLNKSGKVTAVDTWDPYRLSGNSLEAARENAKREGVGDRVRFDSADPTKLAYPAGHFDAVLSSLAFQGLPEHEQRAEAVRQMYRVLKPGGKLLIHDLLHASDYARILRECSAQEVAVASVALAPGVPSRLVSARK